jgi:hypothetical protein
MILGNLGISAWAARVLGFRHLKPPLQTKGGGYVEWAVGAKSMQHFLSCLLPPSFLPVYT